MIDNLKQWNLSSAKTVLDALDVSNIQVFDDRIRFSCLRGLMGKQYHFNKNISNPAGELTIQTNGSARYHCFSCMEDDQGGDLEIFPHELRYWAKNNPENLAAGTALVRASKALQVITAHHVEGVAATQTSLVSEVPIPFKTFMPYPAEWLQTMFPPAQTSERAMSYLHGRGLSDATIEALDIRCRLVAKQYLYVAFPYYTPSGELAGVRGRCIEDDHHYTEEANAARGWPLRKHKPFTPDGMTCNESLVWYRQSELDTTLPVIVTEGQFDAAAIMSHHENVTCLFKASAAPSKLSYFAGSDKGGVVLLLDNDPNGSVGNANVLKSRNRIEKYYIASGTKFVHAFYPDNIKDASECPPDVLKDVIFNALEKVKSLGQ